MSTMNTFSTDFYSSFLYVVLLPFCLKFWGVTLTCLTGPHSLCMCLSQVRSLKFSSCRLMMWYIFVFRSFFSPKIRPLVFSLNCFTFVIPRPFIIDYAVWYFAHCWVNQNILFATFYKQYWIRLKKWRKTIHNSICTVSAQAHYTCALCQWSIKNFC